MELERRRRRRQRERRKNRRNRKKAVGAPEDAMRSIHDVPDDLLRRFFLGLNSPIWLIRAACTCKRWRRAITDGDGGDAFLRLASSLHPPTVVGQYHNHDSGGGLRFVLPSSSSTAPIDVSRFTVDRLLVQNSPWQSVDGLLVKNARWHVADCHGGLVLLHKIAGWFAPSVPIFVVYDPLSRQHHKIYPPLPAHKQWQVHGPGIRDAFLLDGNDGNISVTNFRVLYRWINGGYAKAADPEVCVFSTSNGGHRSWRFLRYPSPGEDLFARCSGYVAGRVDGSLYLGLLTGAMIALDNTTLVFSKVDLPIYLDDDRLEAGLSTFTVVHGAGLGPGSPPRTSIVHVRGKELELFRRRVQGGGGSEWVLEHSIANLSEATRGLMEKCKEVEWSAVVAAHDSSSSFAVLSAYWRSAGNHKHDYDKSCFFSMDVNTMELQVLPPKEPYRHDTSSIFNYTLPWPQFLQASP